MIENGYAELHYYKQLHKQIDAHHTKAASIELCKRLLERKKIDNYTNGYDHISGLIAQNNVKGTTVEHLRKS